jgi:hypothetical protein
MGAVNSERAATVRHLFSAKNLATRLQQEGMLYLSFGDALASARPVLYCDGAVD